MRTDFANQLLLQIEMLRAGISHGELSKRLGDRTERRLARYVGGKTFLLEDDLHSIAGALRIDIETLARAWAGSVGLRPPTRNAARFMFDRAYRNWRRHSRVRGVPPDPSPMTIIRARYAGRLLRQIPPLRFRSKVGAWAMDTPEGHERFARAYEMLVEFVHDNRSQRDIGAIRGISGERVRQLMLRAAHIWAKSEGINLAADFSVPFKYEAKLVKNLYAGLRFLAQHAIDLRCAAQR